MRPTMVLFTLFAVLAVILPVASAQVASKNALPPATQDAAARDRETNDLVIDLQKRAADAAKQGKPRTAELLYHEALSLRPGRLHIHADLARLYDRVGRDEDAYREYRALIVGRPNTWCSDQENPNVLARYGDLSLRFGTPDDAARAYRIAAAGSTRDDVWEPQTLPRNDAIASLKAAAHTAAAVRISGNKVPELRELQTAIAADPSYWVPHYYLARLYRRFGEDKNATKEAEVAQRLAPTPKYRAMVARLRSDFGI